ncbi:hypothetical protein [Aromatoleum buckelii]|uniref:Uncharacterized protein n=1 Tax=Aromatoleum buckelii TaxID=200254 RepID=A0ABX1N0H8_9RHOO|nr:hypothetical protein [Aromatoleum buckelii]MCK0512832.1 hypothetical protein [Aromatoleum buckelii]
MPARRRYSNRNLTQDSYVLTSDPTYGLKRIVFLWGLVIVVLVMLGLGVRYFEDRLASESSVSAMRQQNRELQEALSKARFDLEVELATRGELERQVVSLNDELKEIREELAFIKSATKGALPAR